jgi:hypothetical protein
MKRFLGPIEDLKRSGLLVAVHRTQQLLHGRRGHQPLHLFLLQCQGAYEALNAGGVGQILHSLHCGEDLFHLKG